MDLLNQGKALLSDSESETFYQFGFSHYNSGNWLEAADVFRLLCARRPVDSRFWFGLGAALQEGGSYFDALHAWAMASLLKKEDPYPHFHAAECYFSLLDPKEGAKALHQAATRIEQNHPLEKKIAVLKEQWKISA
ncbi:MAG TPA: tetratricopeptide repeat protein [Chlamydiales bacterium]|nr:tetratricopeptide repeat protein [Chlamydiales bacterium]